MSRRGNCWDNAVMELFFSRMKVELIYRQKFNSLQVIKSCIFEYIEIFYYRVHPHSTLGKVSPYEYEATCAQHGCSLFLKDKSKESSHAGKNRC
ncbi:IS3 family transposase [Alteromonas macleodii]